MKFDKLCSMILNEGDDVTVSDSEFASEAVPNSFDRDQILAYADTVEFLKNKTAEEKKAWVDKIMADPALKELVLSRASEVSAGGDIEPSFDDTEEVASGVGDELAGTSYIKSEEIPSDIRRTMNRSEYRDMNPSDE